MFGWETWLSCKLGYFELGIRLLAACICGALIGLERTKRQKEAGVRTHILVTLGSCLVMIVSRYGFINFAGSYDPSRIASNVITGISFLGAGIIFVRGSSVKGLTTAAGVWTTAGVGLAIGSGLYTLGFVTSILMIGIQMILHRYFSGDMLSYGEILMSLPTNNQATVTEIRRLLIAKKVTITEFEMKRRSDGFTDFKLEIRIPSPETSTFLLDIAQKYECITAVTV